MASASSRRLPANRELKAIAKRPAKRTGMEAEVSFCSGSACVSSLLVGPNAADDDGRAMAISGRRRRGRTSFMLNVSSATTTNVQDGTLVMME